MQTVFPVIQNVSVVFASTFDDNEVPKLASSFEFDGHLCVAESCLDFTNIEYKDICTLKSKCALTLSVTPENLLQTFLFLHIYQLSTLSVISASCERIATARLI